MSSRLKRLRHLLQEKELDGIFISQPDNRFYLSGFNGSAGYLLITQTDTVLATDFRYVEQVKEQSPDYRLVQITGNIDDWFPGLMAEMGLKKLAFESTDVNYAFYRRLSDALEKAGSSLELIPEGGLVESLRVIKDSHEIELITRAVEITDKAFEHIEATLDAGMTEKEVVWELEKFQREHGSQSMPFDIIVGSGPNAALPHAQPSDRKIGPGETVVIDMGARVSGYTSDFTRTICVGEPDDKFKKIYDIVLAAQLAAIELIKEGMTGEEADSFARIIIEEAGYADYFGHSLGHGVGLVTHEQPRLGPNSSDIITAGMVFSIEPGIYLPGWGGVRIEDLVVMEKDGIRVLSKGRK